LLEEVKQQQLLVDEDVCFVLKRFLRKEEEKDLDVNG